MSDLALHSLAEFAPLILPCLDHVDAKRFGEISLERGSLSKILAERCTQRGGKLIYIDPEPGGEFDLWAQGHSRVTKIAQHSLEALKDCDHADAWFVDGDHNYYTVYHELKLIDRLQRAAREPLLAFVHDVSWPCGRRDFYADPTRIPRGWRHPHSFEHGVLLGEEAAMRGRGFRGPSNCAVALEAGGPRNGVLSAVEDFLKEAHTAKRPLLFVHVPAFLGLGVVYDASAEWSDKLTQFLLPYHANPLIARIEENRLRNYLEVIDWQDKMAS
ncbi:MAG: class I SAM-dependent methyltransferase [Pseudomonadota bacterium]